MKLNIIYNCDAISGLRLLPAESVDCIVTSPPYWQMRDYNIENIKWVDGWYGQLGLEPTRDEFIEHLCLVFDECRRVLKSNGTLWVNLGDSYNNSFKYSLKSNPQTISKGNNRGYAVGKKQRKNGLPQKSLCNIPNKFADEMILRGWIMRNEIIWHKPSCLPSSAKDRFTVNFEKLFFFTKSGKYNFTQQFEPYAASTVERYKYPMTSNGKSGVYQKISGSPQGMMRNNVEGRNMRTVWKIPYEPNREAHFAMFPTKLIETPILAGSPVNGVVLDPFMGGGTTACVAKKLDRNYIGFEPNSEYIEICNKRLA